MISPALQAEIEKQLRRKVVTAAPLSTASGAQIHRLTLDDRSQCVAKIAESGMDIEGFMLKYLKEKSRLPVPDVFYCNEHVIIMSFIPSQYSLEESSHIHAADLLANLHQVRGEKFGFERDTLVGGMPQPNPQTDNWVDFFITQRLLYMADGAVRDGKFDKKIMKQVEKLVVKLPKMLKKDPPISLIHGDVWKGNVIATGGRIAAFLDPAIYYAHAEMELATVRVLDTFGDAFFRRYHEINPIEPGFFEERAYIYGLYPLLVHTRLFGITYARKVQKILDKFVG